MSESPFRPEYFEREDDAPDEEFYVEPRLVVHIDEGAIYAAGEIYAELLPPDGEILDLMSSWRSHLPASFTLGRLTGLGMNATEMAENAQLASFTVHNLNVSPYLPFEASSFDGAICTVSVQYLTQPLAVFAEVFRVLRPGASFIVTFSNRCFPTKAVRIWRALDDREHGRLVAAYFQHSASWTDITGRDCSPHPGLSDPLFAVYACKPPGP